jgi:hypothetical protein
MASRVWCGECRDTGLVYVRAPDGSNCAPCPACEELQLWRWLESNVREYLQDASPHVRRQIGETLARLDEVRR